MEVVNYWRMTIWGTRNGLRTDPNTGPGMGSKTSSFWRDENDQKALVSLCFGDMSHPKGGPQKEPNLGSEMSPFGA